MKEAVVTLQDIRGLLSKPSKSRNGSFTALCPVHDDKKPSLSVSEKNGRILLRCHAGCSFEDICAALGIEAYQLFTDTKAKSANKIETVYTYRTESGATAYEIIRKTGKHFYCRRPGYNGNWIYNRSGVALILYNAPAIKAERDAPAGKRRPVFICEGEKDVETLSQKGLVATCKPFGAGKWRPEYNASLASLDCIVLPDNDEAGLKHAEEVARSIGPAAASVKVVPLPDLPDKGDVTYWFENGGTVEKLNELVHAAVPVLTPEPAQPSAESGLTLTSMADFLIEPAANIQYVWDDTLPAAGVSITSAKPKEGKSTLLRNVTLAIARGEPLLGRATTKGAVLYLCLEEIRDQVREVFRKMGATDERIYICTSIRPDNFLQDLRAAIHEHDISMVIGDPLSRVVRESDFNDYAKMAHALEEIIDFARRLNVHICFAHHDNKSGEGSSALLGSTALFAAVDTLLQITSVNGARTLRSRNRYGVDFEPTVLEFNPVTRTLSVDKTVRELKASALENRVFEAVYQGQSVTTHKIKETVKGSMGDVSKALKALREAGKLVRTGIGMKNDPFVYSVDPNQIDF